MFLHKVITERRIPFELKLEEELNEKTVKVMFKEKRIKANSIEDIWG